MLGRCGVAGIRARFDGDCSFDFDGLAGGLTIGLGSSLCGDLHWGGEL